MLDGEQITLHEVPGGPWAGPSLSGDGIAVVSRGFVMRETLISHGRGAYQLFGPEDLLPAQHQSERERGLISWQVLSPLRLALVDMRSLRAGPSRGVAEHLLRRAERQLDDAAYQLAVMQLPKVDERLLGLFWLFARRWGRMTAFGIRLDLSLRHDVIGRFVGAKRSTVSWGMAQLAERGVLEEVAGGVLLAADGDPAARGGLAYGGRAEDEAPVMRSDDEDQLPARN